MAKKGLGRGLGALIPDYDENIGSDSVTELKIIDVEPRENQPRSQFDSEKLSELASSIAAHGVIQPILVTKNKEGGYRIIAGERRWRAAKLAGLKTIPAIIREYDDLKVFEVALIENLQREDLNPIEEAAGYKSLIERFGFTQEQISERVGKSRSAVANALRFLSLPPEVTKMLEDGLISSGHAKVILSLPSSKLQIQAARYISDNKLSVRETEIYVKSLLKPKKAAPRISGELKNYLSSIENEISGLISAKVKIHYGKKKGKIEIQYYNDEDLERILDFFKK